MRTYTVRADGRTFEYEDPDLALAVAETVAYVALVTSVSSPGVSRGRGRCPSAPTSRRLPR